MILRVDAKGGTSRLISLKLCSKSDQKLKWHLEDVDEQSYAIQAFTFLIPWLKEDWLTSFHKMFQQA